MLMLQEEASVEAEASSSSAHYSLGEEAAPQYPNQNSPWASATNG